MKIFSFTDLTAHSSNFKPFVDMDLLSAPSLLKSCVVGGIVFVFSVVCLYLYRLFFHPLAKYPGPKLAAATNWYEFYYDVIQHGNFTHHIQQLHKQYGMHPLAPFPICAQLPLL